MRFGLFWASDVDVAVVSFVLRSPCCCLYEGTGAKNDESLELSFNGKIWFVSDGVAMLNGALLFCISVGLNALVSEFSDDIQL